MTASIEPGPSGQRLYGGGSPTSLERESFSFPILPEPPSADPHARWCGEGGQR
jgi:hypothetical protein